MKRREFLRSAAALSASAALPGPWFGASDGAGDQPWRRYRLTTRVSVARPSGATRVWVPVPLRADTPYQKSGETTFTAPGGTVRLVESGGDALGMVSAEFPAGTAPVLTVTSRVSTRDVAVDLTGATAVAPLGAAEREHYLRPTKLIPTGGIVGTTARAITAGASGDRAKARAIYEWIVDNTFRDPKTRGCGIGDIGFMLESRNLGGKCADLNALFVGLARAAGLPARDVYGIRAARSDLGYRSLGAASDNVTKAQHCRAVVFLADCGWVPVDPADVRKVVLEEPPGGRPLDDAMVRSARARLFGSWEMNWIAYNFAHDVALPGSSRAPVGYLMYPQAETADGRIDSLEPDTFSYEITCVAE
jgi:transglutaminase-like putative cysteine protease